MADPWHGVRYLLEAFQRHTRNRHELPQLLRALAYAVATLDEARTTLRVLGNDPARDPLEHRS